MKHYNSKPSINTNQDSSTSVTGSNNAFGNERSNVNIMHMNASSYNFVIGVVLLTILFMNIGVAAYLVSSANSFKKKIETRLDAQDNIISVFITNNR